MASESMGMQHVYMLSILKNFHFDPSEFYFCIGFGFHLAPQIKPNLDTDTKENMIKQKDACFHVFLIFKLSKKTTILHYNLCRGK